MTEVGLLDARVTRMEEQITSGFDRIELLIRQEIKDLKDEQIAELRKSHERLADDQRRLWDRVNAVELRENQRIGSTKTVGAITHFFSASAGGLITWLVTWLSGGSPPHHP